MEKPHRHHHLRNIFKKDGSESDAAASSHINLTKLFHKEKTPTDGSSRHSNPPSDKSDRSASPQHPTKEPIHSHETNHGHAHGRSHSHGHGASPGTTDSPVHTKQNGPHPILQRESSARHTVRRAETLQHIDRHKNMGLGRKNSNHDKIVYNPFGINKSNSQVQHSASFYLKGGPDSGGRVVSNPVANPNDYLPPDLQEEHINLLEDFQYENIGKTIGDGGSCDVRKVTLSTNKKRVYALKRLSLFTKETDEEFYQRAAKEYIISKKLSDSRHCVSTLALLRIQSQGSITRGWGMILEYCGGGDLFNLIIKSGWKRTPLSERYCLFKQIAYGLKFMHDSDIVHRDLKPENILLDANAVVKLCDFGVSDFGHEEPTNFDSPIKTSTAYVGSPPYSPPEVMSLKDCSPSELKKHAYDPFKMDHWGLGMLLFCLIYSGVPFQHASTSDVHFRDYKFNRDRYISDNPSFKNNQDFNKGPGSEFKWASQFQSSGAARVAWKLCDPSVVHRYNLDDLFHDPWFIGLEMCIYEHPDQQVDPLILSSGASSLQNSRAPSRKNTVSSFTNRHDDSDGGTTHTPVRSMLDLAGSPALKEQNQDDNASIRSSSSLSGQPLMLHHDDKSLRTKSENSLQSASTNGLLLAPKSMLDVVDSSEPRHERVVSSKLLPVKEVTAATNKFDPEGSIQNESDDNSSHIPDDSCRGLEDLKEGMKMLDLFSEKPLRESSDLRFDSDGVCELGYKIKKHHHLEVSNVSMGGSSRR